MGRHKGAFGVEQREIEVNRRRNDAHYGRLGRHHVVADDAAIKEVIKEGVHGHGLAGSVGAGEDLAERFEERRLVRPQLDLHIGLLDNRSLDFGHSVTLGILQE